MRLRLFSLWLAVLGVLALAPMSAAAQSPLEKALERFAADSYGDTIAGIEAVVASGDARAGDILDALGDGRLLVTAEKRVVVKTADGKLADAANGKAVDPAPSNAAAVRLNNRVRNVLQGALGGLGLMNSDGAKRQAAAAAILKSRDSTKLAALETALAKEAPGTIRAVMEAARAAIIVGRNAAPEVDRLAAIERLRELGSREALAVLRTVPTDAPPSVRELAASGATSIENRLALWGIAQNFWYGLSLGSVLLLAAIGLAITFGVMGVINMAHGEMVMIGAYTTFVVQSLIRRHAPGLEDASLLIALPAAFLMAAAVGVAIERGIISFLYGRPLETLLATWGVSLILQQSVRSIFGPTNQEVRTPSFMSGAFEVGGLSITMNRLTIILFAAAVFIALLFVLKRTALGLQMRAVTQNRQMAANMGIPTARVDAMTFALGSGIAGLAGVALSQIDNVSPNLGQGYIIDSFLVVVFGGVGNLWGTLVGALSLGLANKLLEPYAGAVLGKIALLVLVIVFIQKRPRGLFALKGRAVEA